MTQCVFSQWAEICSYTKEQISFGRSTAIILIERCKNWPKRGETALNVIGQVSSMTHKKCLVISCLVGVITRVKNKNWRLEACADAQSFVFKHATCTEKFEWCTVHVVCWFSLLVLSFRKDHILIFPPLRRKYGIGFSRLEECSGFYWAPCGNLLCRREHKLIFITLLWIFLTFLWTFINFSPCNE